MALDIFLKIEDVPGESTDDRHKDEIEVLSFNWGETHAGAATSAGGAAGRVSMQDFHFTARTSKASPKLFLACAKGTQFKSAILSVRKSGGRSAEYLQWRLSEVLVSSYQIGAAASGDETADQFSLGFGRIEVDYKQQKPDGSLAGSVAAGWDLRRNAPV
jgi:type VI secretion system secreted protein Hcp